MLIHSSVGNTSFNFTENFALFETEIRIAKMSPINLPNSSMNPRLNPTTPSNTINNSAKPSKNQDIYPNNSLKITLAALPSMDPSPRCMTKGITFPMSPRPVAPVSSTTDATIARISSADII